MVFFFSQELLFCWNWNILLKQGFKNFFRKVPEHQGYWKSTKNMFTQEHLTARHWRWVLLLVWYLCCREGSLQPLYKGLCICTYPECHPNLLCKIILRKVWESQKTNAKRELCRHNPRAAFDWSICIVRCLLWASLSPKLSDLLLCSYACKKMPCSCSRCGHLGTAQAEMCADGAAGVRMGPQLLLPLSRQEACLCLYSKQEECVTGNQ